MNLINIGSVNTQISKYSMYNNKPEVKMDEIYMPYLSSNTDYLEFSIDYGND